MLYGGEFTLSNIVMGSWVLMGIDVNRWVPLTGPDPSRQTSCWF